MTTEDTQRVGPDEATHTPVDERPTGRNVDRRAMLLKTGVGAAAVWTAPVFVTRLAPVAMASGGAVDFVAGSAATAYSGPSTSVRTITLSSSNVQVGDLWIAIVAYDRISNINVPSGAGWSVFGPNDQGSTTGTEPNYSTRSYVVARKLVAGDIISGVFSQSFSTTTGSLVDGGLRGAAVAYRAPNVQLLGVTLGNGNGPTSGSDIVTSTFPAATGAPLASTRTIVRLGAARGYGGCNALDPDIDWQSAPGTTRVDYSTGNEGDRALVISDQVNGTGVSATGTWYRQGPPLFFCTPVGNWTTFTAVLRDV